MDKERVYEQCYVPERDEALKKLGVELCARAETIDGKTQIKIVFRRGKKESSVDCVKTFVGNITIDPESQFGIKEGYKIPTTVSVEDMRLSPQDSFWAIKSFTQQLVEIGIKDSLIDSFEHKMEIGSEPAWFNEHMRNQIVRALIDVAPEESKELALSALEYVSADDPERLKLFSRDFKEVICNYLVGGDFTRLDKIDGGLSELHPEVVWCLVEKEDLPFNVLKKFIKLGFGSYFASSYTLRPILPKELEELVGAEDPEFRLFVAQYHYKKIPPNLLQELISDKVDEVRIKVSRRDDLSTEDIRKLARDTNKTVRSNISYKRNLPLDVIKYLMEDEVDSIRANIIDFVNDESDIRKLSKDPYWLVRKKIVRKRGLPIDILRNFAVDPSEYVRKEVALLSQFSELPDDMVVTLSSDSHFDIRKAILSSRNLPDDAKRIFAKDSDVSIRMGLAQRGDLPEDVIETLARDLLPSVRGEVARYWRGLPKNVVELLVFDPSVAVSVTAIKRNEISGDLMRKILKEGNYWKALEISRKDSLPEDISRTLEEDYLKHLPILENLATVKNLPTDVVKKLANNLSSSVRGILAKNESVPIADIVKLVRDRDGNVRAKIAEREDLPQWAIRDLSDDKWVFVRANLAKRRDLPIDVWEKLSKDRDRIVVNSLIPKGHLLWEDYF